MLCFVHIITKQSENSDWYTPVLLTTKKAGSRWGQEELKMEKPTY